MLRRALAGFAIIVFPLLAASAAPERAAPTRPGTTPPPAAAPQKSAAPAANPPARGGGATRNHPLGTVNVDLVDAAERFGVKAAVLDAGKKVVLTGPGGKVELEVNSREIEANGVRVFLGTGVIARRGKTYVSRIDFDGCLLPLLQPARIPVRPPAPRVIAIDPGHGGVDNGMQNEALGLKEKVLALDVAQRAKKVLETAGYKVVLTRTDDRIFSSEKRKDLTARAAFANRAGADVFVSIHFNSLFPDTKTSGTEVYVYSRRGQRSDSSHGYGEEDDSRDDAAAVNRFDAWSTLLANKIHRAVIGELKTADRGQKTKHLLVLQDVECPAVLVESVFLSNPVEAKRAATPAYRQQIAEAIADGIRDYAAVVAARAKP